MSSQKSLNPQQLRFVENYIENGNATKSARLAGYSEPQAYGLQLLEKQYIIDEIKKRKDLILSKSLVTKLELVNDLKDILDNTKETSPKTAILAIQELNRMLGFHAPVQTEINMVQEQPLFNYMSDEIIDYEGEDINDPELLN